MTNGWMAVATASAAAGLARELLGLVRHLLRRGSIERLAAQVVQPGSSLVDPDEHGARFELTIENQQPQSTTARTDTKRNGTQ